MALRPGRPSRLRRLLRPALSLRARLLLLLLGSLVVGLAVADTVTYRSLRSYLVRQVDQQVGTALAMYHPVDDTDSGSGTGRQPPPYAHFPGREISYGTYRAVVDSTGAVVQASPLDPTSTARPDCSDVASWAAPVGATTVAAHTVTGTGGISSYRLEAQLTPSGQINVAAVPLSGVQDTLRRLLVVELAVSAAVAALLTGAGFILVRSGLRPLERMAGTADVIAAGDLSQRVDTSHDRTEVGRLGVALNAMLGQIEAAFAERTESESRLRRFVADASHELRTPLTSIRGYAEMFRRGAAERPADLATVMRRIEGEADRMGGLVEDMLLLARLDQGRPVERANVDLRAVAADAVLDGSVVDPGRAIALTGGPSAVTLADEARLRQAIGNLLRNALVHTPPGTPVEVSVVPSADAVDVIVADHGPGIPDDVADRVFERFFRADPGRSRDRGGSGLGLSVVAAVAEAHGGSVRVQSTPGGGATFVLTVPRDTGQQDGSS